MKLEFETENAAFDDFPHEEIAQTLEIVAEKIRNGKNEGGIRDCNGHTIGKFAI